MAGVMVRDLNDYWKGGLTGLAVFLLIWLAAFSSAFMISFGNEMSWSGPALRAIEAFFVVANPLWGVPVSVLLGAYFIRD